MSPRILFPWALIKKPTMARIPLASVLSLYALGANAADPSCTTQATEKKLAGAAKISFMNKCVNDAVGDGRPQFCLWITPWLRTGLVTCSGVR